MIDREKGLLLIARQNGSSASRRQRLFATEADVERAIIRWRRAGYTVWWVFGPQDVSDNYRRPLVRHWIDQPAAIFSRLD